MVLLGRLLGGKTFSLIGATRYILAGSSDDEGHARLEREPPSQFPPPKIGDFSLQPEEGVITLQSERDRVRA